MASLTLLDVAKLNGNDQVVGLIEENLTSAPEWGVFPVRQISGTSFYTVKRTGFPTAAFRKVNDGIAASKSSFEKSLHECYVLSSRVQCDIAAATAYEGGMSDYEMIESNGVMRAAMIKLGAQIWYGVNNDANGFPGIKAVTPKSLAVSPAVVDATGTTATTASSVYAVKFGAQDVTAIMGNNQTIGLSSFRDQDITGSNGNPLPGRVADLTAWCGLQLSNVNCVGRICNLTEDSSKGLTDALIAKLLALYPVGYRPDYLFMSRRSARQLQIARTIVINTNGNTKPGGGVENVAPWPESAFNIPIVVTDSIGNTDAIE